MATILITGGAGFIGSHTADALVRQGHHVRVFDILDPQVHGPEGTPPDYLNPQVEFVHGDVRVAEQVRDALRGVDAVYHFATRNGVGQSMYDVDRYVDTNCGGTAVLLQAIVRHRRNIARLVVASSRAVYGEGAYRCPQCSNTAAAARRQSDMEEGRFAVHCTRCSAPMCAIPTSEERPPAPSSIYAWTKKHQEDLCGHVAQTFQLPVVCLRYFNVYGSRQSLKNPYTGVVSIFYGRLVAGKPIALYEHGQPGRDFVHVSDVVQANLLALEAQTEPGTAINVGTGVHSTIDDVANTLARGIGKAPLFDDRGEFRAGDVRCCYASIERARRLLGYRPEVSLTHGMREFIAWAADQQATDLYDKTVRELSHYGLFGVARGNPTHSGSLTVQGHGKTA